MHDSRPTRRELLAGGAVLGTGLLAGCTGTSGDEGSTPTAAPTESATDASAEGSTERATDSGDESDSYTVEMAPVGEVTFDAPPKSVAHYFPGYADMAVALGHADGVNSIGVTDRYHTGYYDELDGVSLDKSSLTELVGDSGIDAEVFYELDSDLHLIDPRWLTNNEFFGLEESDVEELSTSVAPFIGNVIFRRTDSWHDYPYYTMYEAFEKVAQVHQEQERFEAFARFHDEFIGRVQADLPPEDERPNALLTFASGDEPETFSPYRISDEGTNKRQFHDLGITDALAGTGIKGLSTNDRGQIDYETMLSVDPDSILVRGHEGKSESEFEGTVLAFMRDHPVASELTAVQEGQVFRGGPIYEGPIQNLFLTERFARNYFPETFSGELFDRGALAGVITD
jgi:iron complex transport system substrate-binding protein